jgi:hypothetical protein
MGGGLLVNVRPPGGVENTKNPAKKQKYPVSRSVERGYFLKSGGWYYSSEPDPGGPEDLECSSLQTP